MPTSTTIDGISREHTNWPLAVDGVSREAVSMLAGVDGTQREIFSGMHEWERYSITTSTRWITTTGSEEFFDEMDDYPKNSIFCLYNTYVISGSTFTLSSGSIKDLSAFDNTTTIAGYYTPEIVPRWKWTHESDYGDTGDITGLQKIYRLTRSKEDRDDETYRFYGTPITLKQSSYQSKGTYIDSVKSKDETAYPENGIYNGYWYVKIK